MFSVLLLLSAPVYVLDAGSKQHNHATHSENKARPATPKSDVTRLFGPSNYPAEARAKRLEGSSSVVLTVDAAGMVVACRVTASSGHRELDDGSCRAARRLRFDPARDEKGRRIASEYPMQADWRLGAI